MMEISLFQKYILAYTGRFKTSLQKELYNFESLYTFIQRTYTAY
jgi:hypothetical protein